MYSCIDIVSQPEQRAVVFSRRTITHTRDYRMGNSVKATSLRSK